METIIGKHLFSKTYGEGIIVSEEDGLIWVDFLSQNKKNVCFQATASFLGNNPFLSSEDESVLAYIKNRFEVEKDIQAQNETIENMKNLGIDNQCIESYISSKKNLLFNGNFIKQITAESEPYLYDSIKWFESEFDSKVYATLPVPNVFGDEIFTYVFLEQREAIEFKGNLALTYAYYLNPNCKRCGERKPLGIQITKSGLYALPCEFIGVVKRCFREYK